MTWKESTVLKLATTGGWTFFINSSSIEMIGVSDRDTNSIYIRFKSGTERSFELDVGDNLNEIQYLTGVLNQVPHNKKS